MSAYAIPAFYAAAQLFLLTGLGFVVRRSNIWPRSFFIQLSSLVVRIGLPAYFFAALSRTSLDQVLGAWPVALAGSAVFLIGIGLSALIFAALRFAPPDRGAAIALGGIGNSAFIPLTVAEIVPVTIPLVAERFGSSQPILLIGVYLIGFSPLLWSVGSAIVGGHRGRLKPSQLLSPPVIGILAGLAVPLFGLQRWLFDPALPFYHVHAALHQAGSITLPLILIVLGSFIADLPFNRQRDSHLRVSALAVSIIRFALLPALYYAGYFLVLRPLNAPPAVRWVLFLQTHIPPATSLSVLASFAGVNEQLTAFTLLVTNVLYLVVLPLYLILFLSLPGM